MQRSFVEGNSIVSPKTLAILTPRWGMPSETFVRRHITDIHPGRTVALARFVMDEAWCPGMPFHAMIPNSHPYWIFRELGWYRFDRRGAAIRRFVEEQGVGVILAEWLDFAAGWFPTLRGLNLPFFAHSHGYDVTRWALDRSRNRWRYRRLHHMNGIIAVSEVTKTRLVERIKLNPDLIHVIPCGVDVPHAPKFRSESEHVICLHVGRMVEKKSPLLTLKAFHDAQRQIRNLRLEMIGGGGLLPACQKYCEEHGLSKIVTFHGVQPLEFVKQRLGAADMFLLHSRTGARGDEEGLPVAILEGMAYALPVISTRHAGIPEAVLDGETGVLVNEGDEEAMGRAIRDLAVQPKLRRQMGERGYRRARDMFSAEREIRMLRQVMFGTSDASAKESRISLLH